jgi:thiol-disulfide isomerase/thioredoxin
VKKKIVHLIRCFVTAGIMLLISSVTYSQPNKVPPFQMMQTNGKVFLAGNLPVGKPIVIIYFSPDCKECHDLTKELLNRINEFNNASIAMITNLPLDQVKHFVSEFHLEKYPNIYAGTEGYSSFAGAYYNVGRIPFVALHKKNGDLVKVYDGEISIEDLLLQLRGL